MQRFHVHGTRDTPNLDLPMKTSCWRFPWWRSIAATHPPVMNGPNFSKISRLVMSHFFRPQELGFPDDQYTDSLWIYDTCLSKWTAHIILGFSVWTYLISCPWEFRYLDSRCLDLRHVSPQTDGPDLPGISRLEVFQFSFPRDS
jgi:hypothetical protein